MPRLVSWFVLLSLHVSAAAWATGSGAPPAPMSNSFDEDGSPSAPSAVNTSDEEPTSNPPPTAPVDPADEVRTKPAEGAPRSVPSVRSSASAGPQQDDVTPLADMGAANAAWAKCLQIQPGAVAAMEACLANVVTTYAGTPAGYRADGALQALSKFTPSSPEDTVLGGFDVPPGRLELSSTLGLYGVWTGVASGIAAFAHVPVLPAALGILGTGALSVGLGVGFGFGGYALADHFDLDEGDSRLVASSLVWGTTFGIAAVPALFGFGLQDAFGVSVPLATIVLSGALGGAAALAVTQVAKFNTAEVSLINTGGWIGALFGLLSLPNLLLWNVQTPALHSLSYISFGALGLASGVIASQFLHMTWGETLLLDLGGVLGLVASGTLVFALNATGAFNVPDEILIPLNTAVVGLGALGGVALTAVGIGMLRGPEAPLITLGDIEIRPSWGVPTVVLDSAAKPVLVMPGPALAF